MTKQLSGVVQKLAYLVLGLSQGVSLGDFLLAPTRPHREGNSMGELPLFNIGIRT